MPWWNSYLRLGLGGMVLLLLIACDDSSIENRRGGGEISEGTGEGTSEERSARISGENAQESGLSFPQPLLADAVINDMAAAYVDQAIDDYRSAVSSAQSLEDAVSRLLDEPGTTTLDSARQAWLAAHTDYVSTSLHQYFLQELLARQTSELGIDLGLERLQYQLDHWPILAGYIDYLRDYPDSGLVSDITVPLSRENIIQQHGAFDLSEVLLGFHPLEFLLWGEPEITRAGLRSYTDYMDVLSLTPEQATDGLQLVQLTNNRRRQLLEILTSTLVQDVEAMQQLWSRNRNNLKDSLGSLTGPQQLGLLLDTMAAVVTEELMVRTLSPMLNGDFENSLHAPFSQSSDSLTMAQLEGLESMLLTAANAALPLEVMLADLLPDFSQSFYQNLDGGRECLARLYVSVTQRDDPEVAMSIEVEIVECINFMANLTNTLQRVKSQFP